MFLEVTQANTIEWENGADFTPEYLYDLAEAQYQMASEPNSEYGTTIHSK